jgi:dihydroorotase
MNDESVLIQKARILDPVSGKDEVGDILISDRATAQPSDREIKAKEPNLTNFPARTTIIDGRGLILAPGLVDLYSHSGEPGHEERETLTTLAEAAIAGGFTRLGILPDTKPALDRPSSVEILDQQARILKAKLEVSPHFCYWGALTLEIEGKQMTELADLAPGTIGFADGYSLENLGLLRQLLEYVKPFNKIVALAVNNKDLKGDGVMREGSASIKYGLPGNPATSEAVAIASILELVAASGTPVHLMRVSTHRGVELIADAKARGIPVTASTTWMHLLVSTDAIDIYDPNLRLEPPLGNPDDVKALIDGVKEGIIDAIAIDHSPYTYEEKTLAFAETPPGAIGLELALPLLWQRFVSTREWTALELWQALSTKPQQCWRQQPLSCQVGEKAELVLFNPDLNWTCDRSNLKSLSSNTSWFGKTITGRVVRVWNS